MSDRQTEVLSDEFAMSTSKQAGHLEYRHIEQEPSCLLSEETDSPGYDWDSPVHSFGKTE